MIVRVRYGNGIPEEKLEAIDQVVSPCGNRRYTGWWDQGGRMGLVFCRMITEKLGGKSWAESSSGNGATIFVTISGKKSV
ncbi:ATP-binding protein [Pseudodesulfovibrio sp. S3]|uniref:ATP-binding protein n=1 Tax=Pseudodesulfovibrio sp. S3-i TaxID=2929474 RepID=UPI000FEBA6FA|nr:ATP-binding protein [Pseudodesulfovibrio sp. S3]